MINYFIYENYQICYLRSEILFRVTRENEFTALKIYWILNQINFYVSVLFSRKMLRDSDIISIPVHINFFQEPSVESQKVKNSDCVKVKLYPSVSIEQTIVNMT